MVDVGDGTGFESVYMDVFGVEIVKENKMKQQKCIESLLPHLLANRADVVSEVRDVSFTREIKILHGYQRKQCAPRLVGLGELDPAPHRIQAKSS